MHRNKLERCCEDFCKEPANFTASPSKALIIGRTSNVVEFIERCISPVSLCVFTSVYRMGGVADDVRNFLVSLTDKRHTSLTFFYVLFSILEQEAIAHAPVSTYNVSSVKCL